MERDCKNKIFAENCESVCTKSFPPHSIQLAEKTLLDDMIIANYLSGF